MNAHTVSVTLGTIIVVRGLATATDLNGRFGVVVGLQGTRLLIDIEGTGVVKAIRQENCRLPRPVRSWCHTCHRPTAASFTETGELRCPRCTGTFVEAVPTDEQLGDAAAFPVARAAEEPADDPVRTLLTPTRGNVFFSMGPGGVEFIAPFGAVQPSFEDILNMLHQQSEPRGPPPASREAIDTLEQFTTTAAHAEHDCAVCQDAYAAEEDVTKMPCGHLFHSDCLAPWLKEHNSCPTCRHELPTDDAEYEARKQQQQAEQQQAMNVESNARRM